LRGSPVSSIDLKLATRMLVKHPGLTAVAVLTLALGIPASLWPFHVLNLFETPLPYHEGERIVGVRHTEGTGDLGRATLHEYAVWREAVPGLASMGAVRSGMCVPCSGGRCWRRTRRRARRTSSCSDTSRGRPSSAATRTSSGAPSASEGRRTRSSA